jgi:hypothetical protein
MRCAAVRAAFHTRVASAWFSCARRSINASHCKFDTTSATALANTPGVVEALLQAVPTTRRDTGPKVIKGPEVAAALRALKAIADTSHQVLLHRHGAVAVLLGLLNRGWTNYGQRHTMEAMDEAMDLLHKLWRTGAPTSQAQSLKAVTVLTPWATIRAIIATFIGS